MIISTAETYIKYVSPSVNGKMHDFNLLKKMFLFCINWFENFKIKVDSGYTGFGKIYTSKSLALPYKKSKNNPLSEQQKQFNKELSSKRIVVEHSIGAMKRYQILSNRLRLHSVDFYDKLLGICAGLWNFYISN
jgi:hypothetical protein